MDLLNVATILQQYFWESRGMEKILVNYFLMRGWQRWEWV